MWRELPLQRIGAVAVREYQEKYFFLRLQKVIIPENFEDKKMIKFHVGTFHETSLLIKRLLAF